MNQISRHISYLLLTSRKVSIPGLGTLSASYIPAQFNCDEGIFYPSRMSVRFSTKEHGGHLLEKSLSRRLKITEPEAVRMIENYVASAYRNLQHKGYCRFEGIGYLMCDNEGNLFIKDTFWKFRKFRALSPMNIGEMNLPAI
ncbi:MAG: hypothetical protein J1F16_08930 [Muribaculaceae bacterium]|nr:hypothetical protein [Muribaculaceae bacterium]